MANELKIFENEEFGSIRTVEERGKVLFCGTDVAKALGYADTAQAIRKNCKKNGLSTRQVIDSMGREQQAKFIDEGNLYRLITHSKLPEAEKFESWVFDEVLPAIRKTGAYRMKSTDTEASNIRANAIMLNAKNRVAKQMMELWTAAGVEPQYQALALNDYYDGLALPRTAFKEKATELYDATTIAEHLCIMSKSNKPHAQAVTAIISALDIDESEKALTPYSRNGHDGESIQYALSVEHKVSEWLTENNYPTVISFNNKNYTVKYRR